MDGEGGGLEEHGHQVKRSALEIWCSITLEEMLALFQERVVDAVGENHCDQRVIHITDPRIIRPAFALRLVGEYLRGANRRDRLLDAFAPVAVPNRATIFLIPILLKSDNMKEGAILLKSVFETQEGAH